MSLKDPLETTIKTKIVKYINGRPFGAVQVRHQAGMNKKGDPDITGSYRRLHVEIEVKRPKKQPTDIQRVRLKYWQDQGVQVAVLRSVDGAKEFLRLIDDRIDREFSFNEATGIVFDDVPEVLPKKGKRH